MGPIKGRPRGSYNTQTLKPPENVYCVHCSKSFKRRPILEHHIKVKHLNYRVSCPVCHKQFISKSVWHRHMVNVHSIKSYKQVNATFSPSVQLMTPSQTDTNKDDLPFVKMLFERDRAFPSIANVITLAKDEISGVHLVAKNDIDAGKVVAVSSAFASVECVSSTDSTCFQCGKANNNKFIKCDHCIDTYFCSKKCSSNKFHSTRCNTIFDSSDSYVVRLVFETIKNAFEKSEDTDTFIEFIKGVLFDGAQHRKCKPPYSTYGEILTLKGSVHAEHFEMAHKVVKYLLSLPNINCSTKVDLKRVLFCMACRHISTVDINLFSEQIFASKGICMRFSIHDVISRLNHSCTPNVHHYHDSENITRLVTVRPIKSGDQIYMNYLGEMTFHDEMNRKSYIQKHWSFICNCEMCSNNINVSQPDPSLDYIKSHFEKIKSKSKHSEKDHLLYECQTYLNKYGHSYSNDVEFVVSAFIYLIHSLYP